MDIEKLYEDLVATEDVLDAKREEVHKALKVRWDAREKIRLAMEPGQTVEIKGEGEVIMLTCKPQEHLGGTELIINRLRDVTKSKLHFGDNVDDEKIRRRKL